MEGFADPNMAMELRDSLTRLMIKVLDKERPPPRYGTVTEIAPDLRSCRVRLRPGETPILVVVGAIRPTAIGQTVRVGTGDGVYYLMDVIGAAATTQPISSTLPVPTGFTFVTEIQAALAQWTTAPEVPRYEVQVADNSAFTTNPRTFTSIGSYFRVGNLIGGSTVYGRVRSVSDSGVSAWSVTKSVVVDDFQTYEPTDGLAPTSSPNAIVTGTLGWLLVEWLPISNQDLTFYDIHISTVSGFAPTTDNKVGSTSGTFYSLAALPAGGRLAYDTTYFVRIVARDADGAAGPGAQGSASIQKVNTGDAGQIDSSIIGDGLAPTASPAAPSLVGGVGFIYAKWNHVENADVVNYEVHISTLINFTPTTNTLIHTTPSNYTFIRKLGPGLLEAALSYGVNYYIKIVAYDRDGAAAPGTEAVGQTTQANTADIAVGTITAASGIIANAAIGTAHIVDGNITTAKIADANISSAKITNLAVTSAKIADLAVTTAKIGSLQVTNAKIADLAVTNAKIDSLAADKITAGTISASINMTSPTITGGLISGVTYKSSSGSARIEIQGSNSGGLFDTFSIRMYNTTSSGASAEKLRIYVGPLNDPAYITGTDKGLLLQAAGGPLSLFASSQSVNISGAAVNIQGSTALHTGNHSHGTSVSGTTFGSSAATTGLRDPGNTYTTNDYNNASTNDSYTSGMYGTSHQPQDNFTGVGPDRVGSLGHDHRMASHKHQVGSHSHTMPTHDHTMAHSHTFSESF